MSAEPQSQRHSPFDDFINFNLDMEGVDGISFETVALAMREAIRNLPVEQGGDMWGDQLDRLQATLRTCLSIETIGRLAHENPRLNDIDSQDLDLIVNLSISLAFVCYNQLRDRFDFETDALRASHEQTRRLWLALRAASGWVNKAAAEGDNVAQGMSSDIIKLLEQITPHNWTNNTKTIS